MRAEDTYFHIYKVCVDGKETWTVDWQQDDFFGTYHRENFPTYYDAEHYARTISYNIAYTSEIRDYYDEMGNEVYTHKQARYQLKHPEARNWRDYRNTVKFNQQTREKWNK